MMPHVKLSVVIVNYNVEYFLEQCLYAVFKALPNIQAEVFVVDNNSIDGSVAMVKNKFPEVFLIENKVNTGFSVANNQAIRKAKGEYILLLNPDTLVEEDTFTKTIAFMNQHPQAGGLGVYMIDGSGNFLPESKRGLPTPWVAFYKIFGLSSLFPNSQRFGRYHLGYLDKNQIHPVEVLSGAFMMLRKKTLDEVGLLDEDFFMYGEDIDLSYRIIKGGYQNYYFPHTRIIHYKGESTKKSSVNYVFVFYRAMIIFASKHFAGNHVKWFSLLINLAVYIRASGAILTRLLKRISLPFADGTLIYVGLWAIKNFWENIVKSGTGLHYDESVATVAFPLIIFAWLSAVYYSGGYDKPLKMNKIVKGLFWGTVIILSVYALLSESYRFSRAIILLGSAWSAMALIGIRMVLRMFNIEGYSLAKEQKKNVAVIATDQEFERIAGFLRKSTVTFSLIARVRVSHDDQKTDNSAVGHVDQLEDIISRYALDEVIFCAKDMSAQKIIATMSMLEKTKVDFKIAPPESLYIIGSNSVDNNGELYVIDINSINKQSNLRSKRLFDFSLSIIALLCFPFLFFGLKKPLIALKNIFNVLFARVSWVGYSSSVLSQQQLPKIKPGILNPADAIQGHEIDSDNLIKLNQLYAKDYKINNDLNIVLKGWRKIDRK